MFHPPQAATTAAIGIASTVLWGQCVGAEEVQAWTWCERQDTAAISPELQISGCTTVIQSGLESQSRLANAFYNRGNAYADKGDYDRAIQDFDQTIRLEPDHVEPHFNRGIAALHKGDYDRAIQDFDQAIRLRPDFADAFSNRGVAYLHKGNYGRAIQDYDAALRLKPADAGTLNNRANAYLDQGDTNRAIADYDEAIRLKPDYARALSNRCWTKAFAGLPLQEALSDCEASVRLSPDSANALDFRGVVYFRMKRYDEAIADFNKALSRDPKLASSLYVRGLAKRMRHDIPGGDADIAAAKKIEPRVAERYAGFGVKP